MDGRSSEGVMLEAGLCGLPTIGASIEGIRDVIHEGENGHLVESGDAGAFALAVMQYAGHRFLLERISERTERYTRQFGWSEIVSRYERMLREVCVRQTGLTGNPGDIRESGNGRPAGCRCWRCTGPHRRHGSDRRTDGEAER